MGIISGLSIRWKILIPMSLVIVIMLLQVYLVINMNRIQQEDAVKVNVAGRQRALSQKMTKETVNYILSQDEAHLQEQAKTITTFEASLKALKTGGELEVSGRNVIVKPTRDEEILAKLDEALSYWQQVKPLYISVENKNRFTSEEVSELNEISKNILSKFDIIAGMYETSSAQSIRKSMSMIYTGLGIYLVVLLLILKYLQRKIIKPILDLRINAEKIAGGDLT